MIAVQFIETEASLAGRVAFCPFCHAISREYRDRRGDPIEVPGCKHFVGYEPQTMEMKFDNEGGR